MVSFIEAVARLPLGMAVAIEFLGPLSVAALRAHRRSALVWPTLALVGVITLTEPWVGHLDPLGIGFAVGSAMGWAGYILLTHRIGSQLDGMGGLALSLATAAAVTAPIGAWSAVRGLNLPTAAAALGIALLVPLLPYILELWALRRMPLTAFGTLMAVEPAVAIVFGWAILHQTVTLVQLGGVAVVVVAGIGAQRVADHREPLVELV
jgi:inner membrane transporter RhtA